MMRVPEKEQSRTTSEWVGSGWLHQGAIVLDSPLGRVKAFTSPKEGTYLPTYLPTTVFQVP